MKNGKKIKNNNKLLTGIEPENNLSEAFDDGLTAKTILAKIYRCLFDFCFEIF